MTKNSNNKNNKPKKFQRLTLKKQIYFQGSYSTISVFKINGNKNKVLEKKI